MIRDFVDEKIFLITICSLPGMGRRLLNELITVYGSPQAAWEALQAGLAAEVVGRERYEDWGRAHLDIDPDTFCTEIIDKGIDIRVIGEKGYPDLLAQIDDPPVVLYYKGSNIPDVGPGIAVVGSRKASPYGMEVARSFSAEFSSRGLVVVSGAAYGVDTAAHTGALERNGFTYAVLGCGVDVVYPRSNSRLFDKISEHGCLISEFPIGTPPIGYNFPVRNRIIAGMCLGVVVVEASPKSGALITADYALASGRDVFAVPGPVNSINSVGTNRLIRDGALPATSAEDIIEALGIDAIDASGQDGGLELPLEPTDRLGVELFTRIERGLSDIDNLTAGFDCSPGRVLSRLSMMEIQGLIFKGNDGHFYPYL